MPKSAGSAVKGGIKGGDDLLERYLRKDGSDSNSLDENLGREKLGTDMLVRTVQYCALLDTVKVWMEELCLVGGSS